MSCTSIYNFDTVDSMFANANLRVSFDALLWNRTETPFNVIGGSSSVPSPQAFPVHDASTIGDPNWAYATQDATELQHTHIVDGGSA